MARIATRVIDYVGADNMTDGKLPDYAWPGGYPLFYVTDQATVLCPTHANAEGDYDDEQITYAGVNWEDSSLECEHGHRIISAYAEDDAAILSISSAPKPMVRPCSHYRRMPNGMAKLS